MGTEFVLGILAAWFAASLPLGAFLGRMLRSKPPVELSKRRSGAITA